MPSGYKRPVRANQPAATGGFSTHFKSPLKKTAAARQRLEALLHRANVLGMEPIAPVVLDDGAAGSDVNMADWTDMEEPLSAPSPPSPPRKPTVSAAQRLNDAWNRLLPQLETPWLRYYERTHGRPRNIIPAVIQHECTASCETSTVSEVKCLYPTHIQYITVSTCSCKPVAVLVEHGVFPASPTKTKTGLAIDLLDLYRALFERSCDTITALAAVLHTLYDQRGFRVLSEQNTSNDEQASDPYRRLLIQAVQWAANLRDRVERKVDAMLAQVESLLSGPAPQTMTEALDPTSAAAFVDPATAFVAPADTFVDPATAFVASAASTATEETDPRAPPDHDLPLPDAPGPSPASGPSGPSPQLKPGRTDWILRERCPVCFNLNEWGRSLGGDVQFGADGCFSYRHLQKAGDGPILYDPNLFIPKHNIDAVGKRLKEAKERPAAKTKPSVPQEVIDACQDSWDVADENKRKADPKRYDATGIFVMTCRHGQPIFLCNVDTPGEQQRYIVAMLEEVAGLLPSHATILQAYDVGCVTDHSLNLHPIFPAALRERISFVINGMHAYGHHWACQLVYSPRFRLGIGLADHEGVERFWSRIRKLIPLTRGQWNSRRLWMIDQYATFVNAEGRAGLGNWIHRQQRKNVTPRHRAAMRTLQECRVPVQDLHAPARLRRELSKVLLLQNQIDAVEKAINETKKTLHGSISPRSLAVLHSLEKTHERLSSEAEELYASLNIQKDFPELLNLPLEFAQTLLLMRDLKINIRKRAIGSFFEWESLDRAVSGRREALGTKLHQSTRKAISRRQPSLLKAIKKFNKGCETLERLRPPQCNIPIPSPLSVQLNGLWNDPSLHEDVWITPSDGPLPRWLNDEDVRDGIRSIHAADRCTEEVERKVVRRAIEMTPDSPITFLLRWREDALMDLERSWAPFLRFQDVESCFITESTASTTAFRTSTTAFGTSATPFAPSTASATTVATIPTIVASSSSPVLASQPIRHPTRCPPVAEVNPVNDLFEEAEEAPGEDGYELDPGAISDEDQANFIQEVLDESDDEDEPETSAVEASDCLNVKWDYIPSNNIDTSFIPDLATRNTSLQVLTGDWPHFIIRPGFRPMEITVRDMAPFVRPTGRLTGFGLNGVAASLHTIFSSTFSPTTASASQCAILSTYDLPCVRYKGSDPDLWRRAAGGALVWLPAEVGDKTFEVMVLITRLVVLANRNHHPLHISTTDPSERWAAHPLFTVGHPRQTNGYDCGLWVLCMMAAIMRGYQDVHLSEAEMPWVWGVLRGHIRTLPIT
ncbi:hypothetical protein B0H13DRAFT_2411706 [Mycena leptocephala]|nr:hypothetical protein B0H13DRAFT_2411706 [Mycena leptocephala]